MRYLTNMTQAFLRYQSHHVSREVSHTTVAYDAICMPHWYTSCSLYLLDLQVSV